MKLKFRLTELTGRSTLREILDSLKPVTKVVISTKHKISTYYPEKYAKLIKKL